MMPLKSSYNINQPLWAWSLRPTKLSEVIADQQALEILQSYQEDIPNIILSGPVGSGKTTIATLLARRYLLKQLQKHHGDSQRLLETGWSHLCLEINGSLERSKKIVSDCKQDGLLLSFIKTKIRLSVRKVVIIRQFDNMVETVQMALKRIIELHESKVRFIFTVEQLHLVTEAIQSRTLIINLSSLNDQQMHRLLTIVAQRACPDKLSSLRPLFPHIIATAKGDAHGAINYLQYLATGQSVRDKRSCMANDFDLTYQLLSYIINRKTSHTHHHLRSMFTYGYTIDDIVDIIIKIIIYDYRQLLSTKHKQIIISQLMRHYYLQDYSQHPIHLYSLIVHIIQALNMSTEN